MVSGVLNTVLQVGPAVAMASKQRDLYTALWFGLVTILGGPGQLRCIEHDQLRERVGNRRIQLPDRASCTSSGRRIFSSSVSLLVDHFQIQIAFDIVQHLILDLPAQCCRIDPVRPAAIIKSTRSE